MSDWAIRAISNKNFEIEKVRVQLAICESSLEQCGQVVSLQANEVERLRAENKRLDNSNVVEFYLRGVAEQEVDELEAEVEHLRTELQVANNRPLLADDGAALADCEVEVERLRARNGRLRVDLDKFVKRYENDQFVIERLRAEVAHLRGLLGLKPYARDYGQDWQLEGSSDERSWPDPSDYEMRPKEQ